MDTIKEEDKYGNNGDKFYSAGRAIVNGAENVSNFVNTVLEVCSIKILVIGYILVYLLVEHIYNYCSAAILNVNNLHIVLIGLHSE